MNSMIFLKLVVILLITAVFSVAVMALWNWLMPAMFGLKTVKFWQVMSILSLCICYLAISLKDIMDEYGANKRLSA